MSAQPQEIRVDTNQLACIKKEMGRLAESCLYTSCALFEWSMKAHLSMREDLVRLATEFSVLKSEFIFGVDRGAGLERLTLLADRKKALQLQCPAIPDEFFRIAQAKIKGGDHTHTVGDEKEYKQHPC